MNVRFTKSAQQRTVATNLAYELVDVMRSQRSLASYYNAIDPGSFAAVVVPGTGCARAISATPSANITRWKCAVREALPDGEANVDLAADGTLEVIVSWGEVTQANESETRSQVTVESRL